MKQKNIGIIGFGNMGSAIAERIKSKYKVFVFDKDKNKTKNLSGIGVAENEVDLVKEVDALILAVKPQDFENVLSEIKNYVDEKLIISIAAGITTSYIGTRLQKVRVIRAMPNLPAKVGAGMTCLFQGQSATSEDLNFSKDLFDEMGNTLILTEEDLMKAATAISGSGPGFFCDLVEGKPLDQIKSFSEQYFIPSLITAATNLAFTPMQAKILAVTTGGGTVQYLISEDLTPREVKEQVASSGGTTEAGLKVLLHDIKNLEKAVIAALKRAEELSKS